MNRKLFYETELLKESRRLLSALDRCPLSASSGCLDREYWGWATKDFANMDLQRGLLVLAYLYKNDFQGNFCRQQPALLEWIKNGLRFWNAGQYKSGAFNHLYAHENSWMAAAFTLCDMTEIFQLIGGDIDPELRETWLAAMEKAGWHLVRVDETHGFISNHRAGAAAGLMGLYHITQNRRFHDRAWELMSEVYARQSKEGWFVEYEGADPGYQTLDTHFQAIFYQRTGEDERVLEKAAASLNFLSYFLHPDGSIGGEYGSRNCPHFFPGGFEVFAEKLPLAEAMARHGALGLAAGTSCGLADADARNAIPLATSYVWAHKAIDKNGNHSTQLPWERIFECFFPDAGIYIRSDEKKYIVFGLSKGGALKIFEKNPARLIYSSCGYAGRLADGSYASTLFTNAWTDSHVDGMTQNMEVPLGNPRRIRVTAQFFIFHTHRLMTPVKFFFFRLFNLTFGRFQAINGFVRKNLILGRYLFPRHKAPMTLTRTLAITENHVEVEDEALCDASNKILDFREYGFLSTIYMASARYFRTQDFSHAWKGENLAADFKSGRLNRSKKII